MNTFQIKANTYLTQDTTAFFHVPYTRMGNPGNPNYVNDLKNTFNNFPDTQLQSAARTLQATLQEDLPQISGLLGFGRLVVCVVPRAKAEATYHANQQLFRTAVRTVISSLPDFVDGTSYLSRHTNTKTTHLPNSMRNYTNDGPDPYPGITSATCTISPLVRGMNILLIDDIYTPNVNIDEDAIGALLQAGARTVTFYAVGKV